MATDSARDLPWLIRNASRVGATNVALVFLGVGQSVLLARLLGPEGKGEVYLAILTVGVIAQLASLSAGAAVQYHVGKGNMSLSRAWGTIVSYFALFSAIVIVTSAAYLLTASTPAHFDRYTIALLTCLLMGEAFNELVLPFYVAADLVKWRTVAEVSQRTLMLLAALILVLLLHRGLTGAVEAYVIGSLSVQTIVVISLSMRLGIEWPHRADHKQVLSFGMRQHTGAVTARALKRLDGYVLWYFMGSAAVGVYSVAASLAELLLLLPRAIHATLISYVSTNSYDVALRGTRQLLQTGARALIVATTCFALFGYMIIPAVFGAQFDLARSPFVILAFATAFLGLYVIGGAFVIGSNRPHVTSLIMMCSAALNVVLSLLLIPRFGLVGNAAATCVASSVAALMILWQVARPLPARATSEARA